MRIGKRLTGLGILLGVIGLALVGPGLVSAAQDEHPVLIAHASVPDRPFGKTEVQNIFLGKVTRIDEAKITFVILKAGEVHDEFLDVYLSRTSAQFSQHWKKLVFSGKGKSPKSFDSEDELIRYIADTPGVIGYVGAAAADALTTEDIRRVTVR